MTAATAILVLVARTHPAFDARHAVLCFERGPVGLPRAAGGRWPWYTRGVTQQTLAAQIRQLAAERGYDKLDADAQRAMRREIADELGTRIQNVVKALKQTGQRGRRREHLDRCPLCEHAITTFAAQQAIERNLPKLRKHAK